MMGAAGAAGAARHPHQHGRRRSAPTSTGAAFSGAPAPAGLSADEKRRLRASAVRLPEGHRLRRTRWGCGRRRCTESRIRRSAWRPTSSITTRAATRSSRASSTDSPEGLTRDDILDNITITWLTNTAISRRPPLLGVLGKGYLQRQGRLHPGGRERLPRRALSGAAELGGAGVSQADPLQHGPQGRALRGLGAAGALLPRNCARASARCGSGPGRVRDEGIDTFVRWIWRRASRLMRSRRTHDHARTTDPRYRLPASPPSPSRRWRLLTFLPASVAASDLDATAIRPFQVDVPEAAI